MRLLYFLFEFQPIANAVPPTQLGFGDYSAGGSPRVERRGRMLVKVKINYSQDRFACPQDCFACFD